MTETLATIDDDHELSDLGTYDVTLEGFDGATDETDHLVIWVKAPSLEAVKLFIERRGWKTDEPYLMSDRDLDDGVDCVIDKDGHTLWEKSKWLERLPSRFAVFEPRSQNSTAK